MSNLGDFLERFYAPEQTFHTVQARVRHTIKAAPENASSGRTSNIGRPRRDRKPRSESVEVLQFWAHYPDKARIESTRTKREQSQTTIEIVNGEDQWKRFHDGTVERDTTLSERSRGIHRLPTELERHFGNELLRQCFAALTLEVVGTCEVANRDCLKLRAKKLPEALFWPHWFSFEAIEFELAADIERAVLLSIIGVIDEQPVDAHEVFEVSFDEELDDSLFTYEAGLGETVQPATPTIEHTTLRAAAARAPFTVLVPSYLPEMDSLYNEAIYHPNRPDCKDEHLTIFYRGAKSYDSLWIQQSGHPDSDTRDELEWDEFEHDGQRMQISDPYPEQGRRILCTEQAGTHVSITSDLPRDKLARIAASLSPVGSGDKVS